MAVRLYLRSKRLTTRLVDDEAFVISDRVIKHLNPVATIIWLCIQSPCRERDIVDVLSDLFPGQSASRLRADIRRTLRELNAGGLISVAEAR